MKVISVENVSKKFVLAHNHQKNLADAARNLVSRQPREDFWALKDVSFGVEQGEAIGIIGRNGAGKSTILKLITGIMQPTSGRIRRRGRLCSLIEVGAGFHPEMTGRENIYLNGSILGMSRREIDGKLDEIVSFAELERFIDTPVKRYSSGMYARLGFSVAAHVDPDILIVDEVLAVGDGAFQRKCLTRMQETNESDGSTILFVSHNLSSLRALCRRGIVLRQGSCVFSGTADDAVAHYLEGLDSGTTNAFEDNPDRSGTGAIRLISATLRDAAGQETSSPVAGEQCDFCFGYRNFESIKRCQVVFTIFNSNGVPVTNVSNTLTNYSMGPLAESGCFVCRVPRLPLPIGSYRLAVALVGHGENLDLIPNAMSFAVDVSRFYITGQTPPVDYCGCMLEHSWTHEGNWQEQAESAEQWTSIK